MTGSGPVRGRVRGTVPFSAVDGPGSRYVVFLQGCGFDCLTCHNPATIPKRPPRVAPRTVTEVVDPIADAAPFLSGVTVTGGEPTVQAGFTHALLTELAARPATAGLHRLLDSNGDAPVEVWARLTEVCDGVVLDLKALDPQIHYVLTGRSNARVVTALRYLAGRGRLAEVRLLLVPGLNDADATLTRTADWLRSTAPGVRVRAIPFRRAGTRACARDLQVPRPEDTARYRQVLTAAGLSDLVVPDAPGAAGEVAR